MTDDLVKRLNDISAVEGNPTASALKEAADRIEQLNRSSEGWEEIADEYFDAIGERNTRIEKLEAELHGCFHRIEELQAALRKIMNLGQSAVPDHWEARCLARDTARKALEGKDD
jgi:chromosome segregation ATPase